MRTFLFILLIALAWPVMSAPPAATFTENKGQWPEEVLYRTLVPGGALFVERSAFTYIMFSDSSLRHHGHAHQPEDPGKGKAHAYRVNFEGAQAQAWTGSMRQTHYENFFIGNDPARWGSGCGVFGEVLLKDLWPGIDLRISGKDGIKYDLIVSPGVDPSVIQLRYEGQDRLVLKNGTVEVGLTTGRIVEEAPIAFTKNILTARSEGGSLHVEYDEPVQRSCMYVLKQDVLSFDTPIVRDAQLIIDPTLTFGSYSGSTADNFGYTATYDDSGHLYGGGIVFNTGYPLTLGVLQNFWAGGTIDVGISKWSPDGTSLVWSTYLGGNGAESPHSLVVNDQDELFVMGSTGSPNMPVTPGAFDTSFNGGPLFNSWSPVTGGYGFFHNNGTDIFVAHFNAGATALIGSTYIGGTGNDGLNMIATLTHNYGDHFRGEIALDGNGNPVVATSTQSSDMPTSPGAPQAAFGGGGQDAYLFRLNPALTTLLWGTYYGGNGGENGLGVQFDSSGEIFISGGTTSSNLPMAGTPSDNSFNGASDGYIARFNATGTTMLSSTFVGTTAYDQAYFVQLNTADEVFVVGQTHGAYPVTPGKYNNPGSTQFVHKFSHDLSTSLWSTRLGNGNAAQDLSPTAFLVSDCGQIYLSGWAGTVNNFAGNAGSSTNGSPVTPDAFQSSTTGSDMYLMVLAPEATALNYATYFGGTSSAEHVDGGTSRFDKNGTVYHAVCAGCGSQDDFPTTPGAWSNTNNSSNCNLGVFKFDLSPAQAIIGINGPTSICISATAQFTNTSVGGTDYEWSFDDGSPNSNVFAPSHTFGTPGEYSVSMVLSDNSGCLPGDTATIVITVLGAPVAQADVVDPICPGGDVQLNASGGSSYLWFPNIGLNANNVANPVSTPPQTMVYSVVVSDACGSDTAQVDVQVIDPQTTLMPDTSVCAGGSIVLIATGGGGYVWAPAATLDDPAIGTPTATPDTTTAYSVVITTPDGCVVIDSLHVQVFDAPPVPQLQDTTICFGTSVQLIATPADVYDWHIANGITSLHVQSPIVTPTMPTLYIVDLMNACGSLTDSAFVDLTFVYANAWPDTLVCPGVPVHLGASGGLAYLWTPAAGLNNDTVPDPWATPATNTLYRVVAFDAIGCTDTAFAFVELLPWPTVTAGPDLMIDYGDVVQLTAIGNGTMVWTPAIGLSDSTSASPFVRPEETTTYTVTVSDALGCKNTDVLVVVVTGSLYLPNTFTPNGDTYNDTFGALGKEIKDFELMVFNRWGELIWTTNQLGGRWDGTYHGVESPIDTYVWRVKAIEFSGRLHEAIGHVNLVR
ncbi:MAG: gliding motility-associated C-terminal domain-containing protein [Flavobacteriales bacterium]|nr:gliding motility-associated C-terminal domain-containing protein [Flavobacteriales bacterium]